MRRFIVFSVLVPFLCAACTLGPHYARPAAPNAIAFKEQPPEGFKQAQPSDAMQKGKWWEIYEDPVLNALEEQVTVSNQNVLVAEAEFRQAKAAVRVARSGLYPTVALNPSVVEAQSVSALPASTGRLGSTFIATATAAWEPDLWGNIHRGITAAAETAQASFADLQNTRLLFQSEL